MKHAVIGTAGHVDHGKTSLVYALTGVQTDRLPEEQRRGITIELGFAPWRIRDDLLVSIIDAPGHRRLVHNMIAGSSGIDVVLLVVAADEGVMPQTREHVAACKLLGVRRAVVAVSKVDRADLELAELAGQEALELCAAHGMAAEAVPCSAKTGQGAERIRDAVLRAIESAEQRRPARAARLGIDRVFSLAGAGTVVTGTLVQGALAVGQPIRVLGAERELSAHVRALHVHGEPCERAQAPTRLAINLAGVAVDQVDRGMTVTDDPHAGTTRAIDAWVEPVSPIRRGSDAAIFIGTARSVARIGPIGEGVLGEPGLARLLLRAPLLALGGDRFVLRGADVDGPAGAVCGGGAVLDARPPRTVRAHKRVALLTALARQDARAAVTLLAAEKAPESLAMSQLASRLAIEAAALADAAGRASEIRGIGPGVWAHGSAIESVKRAALARCGAHHEQHPLQPGLEIQTLREHLCAGADEPVAEAALAELTGGKDPALVIGGHLVRLSSFGGAAAGSAAATALDRVRALIAGARKDGLGESDFAGAGLDGKLARAALASLEREGAAVHAGKLWFDAAIVSALLAQVRGHFAQSDLLTIADFKAMTGLARKQAIPLLEHCDKLRITRRAPNGSDRLKGPSA